MILPEPLIDLLTTISPAWYMTAGVMLQLYRTYFRQPLATGSVLPLIGMAALVAFFPFKHEIGYSFENHLFAFGLWLIVLTTIWHQETSIPPLNVFKTLIITLLFWYILATAELTPLLQLFIALLAGWPTISLSLSLWSKKPVTPAQEIGYFGWFFFATLVVLISLIPPEFVTYVAHPRLISSGSPTQPEQLFQFFLFGVALVALLSNVLFLFQMLPIRGRNQTHAQMVAQLKSYFKLLRQKFDESAQLSSNEQLWLIAIVFLLTGNYFFVWMAPAITTQLVLVGSTFINQTPLLTTITSKKSQGRTRTSRS